MLEQGGSVYDPNSRGNMRRPEREKIIRIAAVFLYLKGLTALA
jgi:hypothetical protein